MVKYGRTTVILCRDNQDLGVKAAAAFADYLRQLAQEGRVLRAIFAGGESQSTFLRSLAREKNIPWERIDCFNIDDFWDRRMPRQFSCGYQTCHELYDFVKPRSVNLVEFNARDPQAEAQRFELVLRSAPIDILCQGIGTSGHLALNEPGVSKFNDAAWVRVVDVAEQSKRQLREDPNFRELGYIPAQGITMTIPAILAAAKCFTVVPLALKKPILTRLAATLKPTETLPASILLEKEGQLFVDEDSCPDGWR